MNLASQTSAVDQAATQTQRSLIDSSNELVALVKLAALHPYLKDLPPEQIGIMTTQVNNAKLRLDSLIREAKGWGIGDVVAAQPLGNRFTVMGYHVPDHCYHVEVLLAPLKRDGSPSKLRDSHWIEANLVKVEPETA